MSFLVETMQIKRSKLLPRLLNVRNLQRLKGLYYSMSLLDYLDYSETFKLHTDACGLGLGAVMYQSKEDGIYMVIAYASSKSRRKYPSHKLEFFSSQMVNIRPIP